MNYIIIIERITPKQNILIPKNIIGITRNENLNQLAELHSAADVFVNPKGQDNYPTVNLEAIACGTPVISYNTGGSIEAINEKTGFIVEQGDIVGLKKAIIKIGIRGKPFYKVICRNYALKHFRKEETYSNYLSLYNRLLTK